MKHYVLLPLVILFASCAIEPKSVYRYPVKIKPTPTIVVQSSTPPVTVVEPEVERVPGPTVISSAIDNKTIYILDEKKKRFYFMFKGQKHYMPKGWKYH